MSPRDQTDLEIAKKSALPSAIYPILFLVIGSTTSIFRHQATQSAVLGCLLLAFGLARFTLARQAPRVSAQKFPLWRAAFHSAILLSSATWGTFSFLTFLQEGMSRTTMMVLLATAGISGGSVLSLAPAFRLIAPHFVLLLAPIMAGAVLAQDGRGSWVFSALAGIYLVYMLLQSRTLCRVVLSDLVKGRVIENQKTELETALAKAMAASDAKRRFLGMMGHEIRTPLNGIIGLTDTLAAGKLDAATAENVRMIQTCGENLLSLVNDLLDVSNMEQGKVELASHSFTPSRSITDSLRMLEVLARRKGLRFECQIDPALPVELRGDLPRLRQILVNLVNNAVKFTESGGIRIEIARGSVSDTACELVIAVSDTGIGISPEIQGKIFDFFSQADESDRRKFGGLGVGLAICRRLCEAMGGQISVESAIGIGSTFRFNVFLSVAESRPSNATPEGRILVAEDNPVNQKLMQAMLKKAGYEADVVSNGLEAVEAAKTLRYSIILMDCQMPEMDGYQATARIRAEPLLLSVAVVALTANTIEGDREKCLAAGMDDYLAKPIRLEALTETLRKWSKREDRKISA